MSDKRYQEEYLRRIHKVQDYIEQHTGNNIFFDDKSGNAEVIAAEADEILTATVKI